MVPESISGDEDRKYLIAELSKSLRPAFLVVAFVFADQGCSATYGSQAADDPTIPVGVHGKNVIAKADALLKRGPPTIADKPATPPSGDRRDYQSLSIYWWPNPINRGVPYIYADGARNPEADMFDEPKLRAFGENVDVLTRAHLLTGTIIYAETARAWLRAWFLDEETRMNPHFRYAQTVPGWIDGTPMGILEGLPLARYIPRSVAVLYQGGNLTDDEYQKIRDWFFRIVEWLENSPQGKYANGLDSNHGTWFDVQLVSYHGFLGNRARAKEILETVGERRISRQIQRDGRQPAELARAKPYDYSCYNLDALLTLCELGKAQDVDVWGYVSPSGSSIGKALQFLEEEERRQTMNGKISSINREALDGLLRRAIQFREPGNNGRR